MRSQQTIYGILLVFVFGFLLVGCKKASTESSDAAIRQAIEEHLSGRPGLSNNEIVMELKQVQVQGDTAEADVLFHSRNDPNAQMSFHYQLHKDGDKWSVANGRPSASGSPHPPSGSPSDGAPPALPEGHPPVQ